jgi:hypothetical protein
MKKDLRGYCRRCVVVHRIEFCPMTQGQIEYPTWVTFPGATTHQADTLLMAMR